MFNNKDCKFNRACKIRGQEGCSPLCYPYVLLHGTKGDGGFWRTTGVPTRYKNCLLDNLPIQAENPKVYEVVKKYISDFDKFVNNKGVGFLFNSIPNEQNKLGTGTGKTTTAITILNEYLLFMVKKYATGEAILKNNPAYFVKASEYQNKYNSQFRGSIDQQQQASDDYYRIKKRMKQVNLLVVDDIAIRDMTEAFKNELYEVIDHRATEGKATIYTSNLPLIKLYDLLGERIASRIEGMVIDLKFKGQDFRKGGLF